MNMEGMNRTSTIAVAWLAVAIVAIAGVAIIGASEADAEVSDLDVTYNSGSHSVGFPTAGLSGEYSASLISLTTDELILSIQRTPEISSAYERTSLDLDGNLADGVYQLTLISVDDESEIHRGIFIVGERVEVTISPASLTIEKDSNGTVSLDASGLSLSDGHTTIEVVGGSLVEVTLTNTDSMAYTIAPKDGVPVGTESIVFNVLFDGEDVGTATCDVTVDWADVSSVALDGNSIELIAGQSVTLTATVSPGTANPEVSWESDDTDVVSVNDGVIVAESAGTATITVKSVSDPSKTAECTVTVVEKVLQSIAITTPPSKTVYEVGDSFDSAGMVVTATYNSGDEVLESGYSISPSGPLSIDDDTITISYDGKTTSFQLEVREYVPDPTGIQLSAAELRLTVGDTGALTAEILPDGAEGTITWSSDNEHIVNINQNSGGYTAVSVGTTTLTATIDGTSISASCTVTVEPSGEVEYVAEYNGRQYTDLEAALYDARNGGTVRLIGDVSDEVIRVYGTVTLELGGHSIECASSINVMGSLTINGSGTIHGNEEDVGAVSVMGGSLTINGGDYSSGQIVIVTNIGGSLTINGGSFSGSDAPIASTSSWNNVVADEAVVNITGGTFSGVFGLYLDKNVRASVSGGTFDATTPIFTQNFSGSISITGGAFSTAVPGDYVAEGYLQQYSNGYYRVLASGSDDPGVIIPPIDDDDDYVPIPPVIDNSGSDDDTTTIVACAAAAVVAALIAVFLIMEYRKR